MGSALKESYTDLEQRVAERTKELATLNTIAQTVSRSLDLGAMLTGTLDKVLEVLEFESGATYLKDLETGELQMACHRGLSEAFRLVVAKGIISARVAESRNPIIIDDLPKEPDAPKEVVKEGYRSVAAVPLLSKGQVQGVLTTASRHLRRFRQQDVDLLLSIGHQIGVAIENARLYEDTKSRLTQLTALQETTRVVASTLELDRLLHLITQQATTLLQGDGGVINLVDWEKNEDEVVATSGSQTPALGFRSPLEGSLSGWVTLHNQPVLSNQPQYDSRVDARWRSGLVEGTKEWMKVQSAALAPLTIKDQVMGTLVVMNKQRGRGEFDQTDLDLLVAFASQAATAIENARLYEQAQQAAVLEERQRLARDLHDAVTQTLFSASLIAEVLPTLWKSDQDEGRRRLEELGHLTRGALAEMRTLLLELRPGALVEASLGDLLRQLAEAISGRTRVPVALTVEGERSLPPEVKVALYRIAQEALNNVAKHAGASRATVSLRLQPEQVELRVNDDGRGFDPDRVSPESLGLGIVRERAQAIGATVTIKSQPDHGTQIAVVWPDPQRKEHL